MEGAYDVAGGARVLGAGNSLGRNVEGGADGISGWFGDATNDDTADPTLDSGYCDDFEMGIGGADEYKDGVGVDVPLLEGMVDSGGGAMLTVVIAPVVESPTSEKTPGRKVAPGVSLPAAEKFDDTVDAGGGEV